MVPEQALQASAAPDAARVPARGAGDARLHAWRQQVVAALVGQACGIVAMAAVVWAGHADWRAFAVWAPLSLALSAFVYLALGRGWTRHLRDPALTAPQIVFSITMAAASYSMCGPMRGQSFLWLAYGLLFSIFALPARQVRAIAAYVLVLYPAVMALMAAWQPERYPWREEVVHALVLLLTVPPMAMMATRMSELRARLGRQKSELEQALARIGEMAACDELTGLPNRRHASEALALRHAAALRGETFAVALIDLDHFKRVNDAQGHAAGDEVLRAFAAAARQVTRGSDLVARWGGEEFIALYAGQQDDGLRRAAERLRERAEALEIGIAGGPVLRITVSIGLATWRDGESAAELVERADRALYRAKAEGRNRVVVAD